MRHGVMCVAVLLGASGYAWAGAREGEGKTLTLMHIQTRGATRAAVEAAVKRFEEATGAKVQCDGIQNDQYKQKIAVALPSSSPPDVFHTWGGGGLEAYVRRGLVEPLPEGFPAEGIDGRMLEFCKVDGKAYAAPVDVSIVAFWYRKSIFEKHKAEIPKTLNELQELCVRLGRAGVTPVALGNAAHWPGAFYFDYVLVRFDASLGNVVREYLERAAAAGEPVATRCVADAQRHVRGLVQAGAFPPGFRGLNSDDSQALFFSGHAAMTLMGSWLLSYAISDRPEIAADLGIFAFPALEAGKRGDDLLCGVNAAYAVSAKCAEKRLAAKLVEFLTDETAAREWVKAGRIPARIAARKAADKDVPSALADAMRLLDAAPRLYLYFDQTLPPAVAEKHKAYTQTVFAGGAARTWPRVVVGAIAVLVLVGVAFALRKAFASGGAGRG